METARFTLEQYVAIKNAVANGTRTVTYGDKSVTYQSVADMLKVLAIIEEDLFPERRQRRRFLARHNRGFFVNDTA